MKGLLDQQEPTGAQAVGPPSQSVPQDNGGVTPEMQAQANDLTKKATEILYADEQSFQKLVDVFKSAKGDQAAAQAMSLVVNGVISKIEQETGPLEPDMIKSVGVVLILTLLQDLAEGGLVNPTEELFIQSAAKALQDWMSANPERVDAEEQLRIAQEYAGKQGNPQAQVQQGANQQAAPQGQGMLA